MAVPTLTPGTDILSEQYNKLVRLFTGASGDGSDTPVSFSRYTGGADYAATIRHRSATDALYKGLIVQDKDGDTVFEVAALGGGGGSADLISGYAPRMTVGSLRNWVDSSDFVAQRQRLAAGTTGAFVTAKFLLESSGRTDISGGSAVDDGPVSSIMSVMNAAAGGGQNAQGTFRSVEAQTLVYENNDAESNYMGIDLGIHTAVPQTGILDDITKTYWGSVGLMIQSTDQTPGTYGAGVAPNAGVIVTGALTPKFGYAFAAPDKTPIWNVNSGGSTRQIGDAIFLANSQRIRADFTHATNSLRLMYETTTTNGFTLVGAKPVGTGSQGGFEGYSATDVANSTGIRVSASVVGGAVLESFKTGTATAPSIILSPGGTQRLELDLVGNVRFPDAGLATTATAGFLYIPSCAGTPTGVPTTFAGTNALVYDRTNDKLAVYRGGWKQTAALT